MSTGKNFFCMLILVFLFGTACNGNTDTKHEADMMTFDNDVTAIVQDEYSEPDETDLSGQDEDAADDHETGDDCSGPRKQECFNGDIWSYDSCGNRLKMEEKCSAGCEGDDCLPIWIDLDTCFMWTTGFLPEMNWEEGVNYCSELDLGGYSNWRLPTILELRTLIKDCPETEYPQPEGLDEWCDPEIPSIIYQEACRGCAEKEYGKYSKLHDAGRLWSSTEVSLAGANFLYFGSAHVSSTNKELQYNIRCVSRHCISHHAFDCYKNNIWWYDSCGEIEEIKESCVNGCMTDECFSEPCVSHAKDGCSYDDLWWYDSCGRREDIKEDCERGCEDGKCEVPWTDPDTGYTWSLTAPESLKWFISIGYCEDLVENGQSGWRLPTISELRTLIRDCPETETGGECNIADDGCLSWECRDHDACTGYSYVGGASYSKLMDSGCFWSISERLDNTDIAWRVCFTTANVGNMDKGSNQYVRCVKK